MKIDSFVNNFLEFEKKNQLFDWKIDTIPIWELIRFKMVGKLEPAYNPAFRSPGKKLSMKLVELKFFLLNFIFRNPFRIKKRVDSIFINHPRRKFNTDSGFYEDTYTDSFLNFIPNNSSYIVLENFYHFLPVNTKNLFYLDKIVYFKKFLKILNTYKLKDNELTKIKTIENKFNKEFGVNIKDLEKFIREEIIAYNYFYKTLTKLFLRLRPNRLIIVVSYDGLNKIACLVAKNLNIPVYELQHGTVGRYHLGYNYPSGVNVTSFPDFFVSWGTFWTEKTKFPTQCKIIFAGFPYLNNQKKNFGKAIKQKQILIISQLSLDVAYFALELSKLTSYKILFKPHPREYSQIKTKYSFLENINNIEILDDPKINIYNYYNTSEYVLGSSSTALIEALSFSVKLIIVKFPGWEYFGELKEDNVFFVNSVEETVKLFSESKVDSVVYKERFFIEISNQEFVYKLLS